MNRARDKLLTTSTLALNEDRKWRPGGPRNDVAKGARRLALAKQPVVHLTALRGDSSVEYRSYVCRKCERRDAKHRRYSSRVKRDTRGPPGGDRSDDLAGISDRFCGVRRFERAVNGNSNRSTGRAPRDVRIARPG